MGLLPGTASAAPTAPNRRPETALAAARTSRLLNQVERAPNFAHHIGKISCHQTLLRIDHHIRIGPPSRTRQPYRLAQPPLHSIALDRASQRAPHGEPNPHSAVFPRMPRHIKQGQRCRKMPPAFLVHAFEIRVAQQARCLGECFLASRLDAWVRFSRHTGGHSASYLKLTSLPEGRAQSRVKRHWCPRLWTIRGNRASPRPACAPWRDGARELSGRPGSSCASGIRASSIACAGSVGTCVWA
jgi:hypothetical protein